MSTLHVDFGSLALYGTGEDEEEVPPQHAAKKTKTEASYEAALKDLELTNETFETLKSKYGKTFGTKEVINAFAAWCANDKTNYVEPLWKTSWPLTFLVRCKELGCLSSVRNMSNTVFSRATAISQILYSPPDCSFYDVALYDLHRLYAQLFKIRSAAVDSLFANLYNSESDPERRTILTNLFQREMDEKTNAVREIRVPLEKGFVEEMEKHFLFIGTSVGRDSASIIRNTGGLKFTNELYVYVHCINYASELNIFYKDDNASKKNAAHSRLVAACAAGLALMDSPFVQKGRMTKEQVVMEALRKLHEFSPEYFVAISGMTFDQVQDVRKNPTQAENIADVFTVSPGDCGATRDGAGPPPAAAAAPALSAEQKAAKVVDHFFNELNKKKGDEGFPAWVGPILDQVNVAQRSHSLGDGFEKVVEILYETGLVKLTSTMEYLIKRSSTHDKMSKTAFAEVAGKVYKSSDV